MKVLSASLRFKDNARTRTFSNIPTYCTKMSGFVQYVYFNAEFMVIAKVFYQGKFERTFHIVTRNNPLNPLHFGYRRNFQRGT